MKKNVDQRKSYKDASVRTEEPTHAVKAKDVKLLNNKPIEVIEPTTQNSAVGEWDVEQHKIGAEVAQALAVLTAAGVIQWEVGSEWARARLCVHVAKYDSLVVCERDELAEDVEIGEFGEPRQEFYGFDDSAYESLLHRISRNWVYPEGY
jgi:hypothetical protein